MRTSAIRYDPHRVSSSARPMFGTSSTEATVLRSCGLDGCPDDDEAVEGDVVELFALTELNIVVTQPMEVGRNAFLKPVKPAAPARAV